MSENEKKRCQIEETVNFRREGKSCQNCSFILENYKSYDSIYPTYTCSKNEQLFIDPQEVGMWVCDLFPDIEN